MPYANNQGVRIHYEVEGEGPPLALAHGLSRSLETWRVYGWVEVLKKEYRLILIDARGHGTSHKPHGPQAYQYKLMAGDVVAVLDSLNIGKAHYFGYSLGGMIGYALATYAPGRFHSFIIGGASAYLTEAVQQFNEQIGQLLNQGIEAQVAALEQMAGPLPAEEKARLLANDARALAALGQGLAGRGLDDAVQDTLATMTIPFLVYVGEADPVYLGAKESANHMPNATFVSLPGLGHSEAFVKSELALPHVTKFLAEVSDA